MQEAQFAARVLHQHLGVGHVGPLLRQRIELVVVGGEHAAGADLVGQVFRHRPGDGEAIEGGGATADFIEQHQRARAGVVKDVGGLRHFHHEGGLAGAEVVAGADAGEDPIGDSQPGGLRRNPAADLRHQLQQARLAQVAAFAAGVGAREHEQVGVGFAPQADAVGGEGLLHQELFHHRMATRLDLQQAGLGPVGVGDLGPAVAAGGRQVRQGGQGIELGHQPRGGPDGPRQRPHPFPQPAKQLVFPLGGTGLELQDAPLTPLQFRGDKALLIGEGLAPDPVLRHGFGFGLAHRQEVAKGAVVLEFEGGDAAGAALRQLLLRQPGVLIVELVAQAIELRVHPVVDQAPLAQAQGRRVHQHVAQLRRQLLQLRPRLAQGQQGRAAHPRLAHQRRQLREALQPIGEGHQIPGGGGAGAGPARQPLQIPHGPQQAPHRLAQLALVHQVGHPVLALEDGRAVHQGRLDPAAQAAAPHGGHGAIQGPQQ